MMCELPSNAVLAEAFLEHFDGMSIGSNDMTQLTLGLDRDSGIIADIFDERDGAVKAMLSMAIRACTSAARWLVDEGIETMSLNPDTAVETWLFLAGEEV